MFILCFYNKVIIGILSDIYDNSFMNIMQLLSRSDTRSLSVKKARLFFYRRI